MEFCSHCDEYVAYDTVRHNERGTVLNFKGLAGTSMVGLAVKNVDCWLRHPCYLSSFKQFSIDFSGSMIWTSPSAKPETSTRRRAAIMSDDAIW